MFSLFAIFLLFKWTRLSTVFADLHLYPFSLSTKRYVHPHKIALIMATSAVIVLYCAPFTHSQFVVWSDFLSPVLLLAGGSKVITRERILMHTLIQVHWNELDLGKPVYIMRPSFAFLGFLGYAGLLLALLFFEDF